MKNGESHATVMASSLAIMIKLPIQYETHQIFLTFDAPMCVVSPLVLKFTKAAQDIMATNGKTSALGAFANRLKRGTSR